LKDLFTGSGKGWIQEEALKHKVTERIAPVSYNSWERNICVAGRVLAVHRRLLIDSSLLSSLSVGFCSLCTCPAIYTTGKLGCLAAQGCCKVL